MVHQINGMVESHFFEDLNFYTDILKKWDGERKYIPMVQELLIQSLNEQMEANHTKAIQDIADALNSLVVDKLVRRMFADQFEHYLKKDLIEGRVDNLDNDLKLVLLFSDNPSLLKQQIADSTALEILALIAWDQPDLYLTKPYLNFWNGLIKNPQERLLFSIQLIDLGENLWLKDFQMEKALNLFIAAETLATDSGKEILKNILTDRLKQLYAAALSTNNKESFQLLLHAKEQLQLKNLDFHEKDNISNQINEAQALFDKGNWKGALEKAKWILGLEPANQKALTIAGESEYQQARYEEALKYLKNVKDPDVKTREALALSQIVAGDPAHGQILLKQLLAEHPLNSSTYSRLGFGLLERNKSKESLKWLKQISEPNGEDKTGLAYAFFQTSQWQHSLDEYNQLPEALKQMPALQSMAMEDHLALGQTIEAEKQFHSIMEGPEHPPFPPSLSLPFQSFKTSILDPQTKAFIAGAYFKKVKHDDQKALEYFKQIKPATPLVLIEMGEILFSQGKNQEAEELLRKALDESRQTSRETEFKQRALPLLAASQTNQGYEIEASQTYAQFFDLFPQLNLHRSQYIQILIDLRLYAKALEQLKILERGNNLSSADKGNFVSALIHTDQFDAARQKAAHWLAEKPPLPLSDQLHIAELLTIIPAHDLIEDVLKKLPEADKLSLDEKEALLSFWITAGDYKKGEELAASIEATLEKSFTGLFLLTKLNSKIFSPNAAKYALLAQEFYPNHPKILELLNFVDFDLNPLKKEMAWLQQKLKDNPSNTTLQFNAAQTFLDGAVKVIKIDPSKQLNELENDYDTRHSFPQEGSGFSCRFII